jgi:peptidoglycan/xylan/chitin deacetylase (PgdA/CDA1 family)
MPKPKKAHPFDQYLYRAIKRSISSWLYYSGGMFSKAHAVKNSSEKSTPWKILRYEHIIEPEQADIPLSNMSYVRPQTFENHLKVLSKHFFVLTLSDFIERINSEKIIPERAVVVTIDCGYKDAFYNAYPLLSKYGVPATFFLPTAFIGTGNAFWNDKVLIALLILQEKESPLPMLPIRELERFDKNIEEISKNREITLEVISFIIKTLSNLPVEERALVTTFLVDICYEMGGFPELTLFLSWDEVRAMSKSPLISFASLTHGHAISSDLGRNEIASNIHESFASFRENNITAVQAVALPDGKYSKENRKVFSELGLKYVFGLENGTELGKSNKSAAVLKRIPVYQDCSYTKDLFAAHVLEIYSFGIKY